jgi:preprotein translocase subunit SecG
MTFLFILGLVVYVLICVGLVAFILAQEGKGGGLSGIMGSSMGETFGYGGATSTIRKFTSYTATAFMVLTIGLTFLGESVTRSARSAFLGAAPAATTTPEVPQAVPETPQAAPPVSEPTGTPPNASEPTAPPVAGTPNIISQTTATQ